MGNGQKNTTTKAAALGAMIVLLILILGTLWMGRAARKDTEESVRLVSLLYLDELAGRREQVVQNNLEEKIRDLQVAVGLMDAKDLDDMEHLQAYQSRMRKLYNLEKFAFVDTEGRIYTADGMQDNNGEYAFDYKTISEPEVSIFNLESTEKKVIIAVPVDLDFMEEKFMVCFMQIDMEEMLAGVSMQPNREGLLSATFTPKKVSPSAIRSSAAWPWRIIFWRPCRRRISRKAIRMSASWRVSRGG